MENNPDALPVKTTKLFDPLQVIVLAFVVLLVFWANLALVAAVLAAAVNTWSKGQKKGAVSWLLVDVFVTALQKFAAPERFREISVIPKPASYLQTFSIVAVVYYVGCAAILLCVFDFLRRQYSATAQSAKIHWGYLIPLFLAGAVFLTLVNGMLLYSAKLSGWCKFPSLYQVVVDIRQPPKDQLARSLIQHDDLGCSWTVFGENTNSQFQQDWESAGNVVVVHHYTAYLAGGFQVGKQNQPLSIWQYIRKQTTPVTQADVERLGDIKNFGETIPLSVSVDLDGLVEHHYWKCFIYGGGLQTCDITFGYKDIITELIINGSDIPDKTFEEIANTVASKIAKRIIESASDNVP